MRSPIRTLAVGLLALAPLTAAMAQGSAFAKFREQHKYTFQLRTMVTGGVVECERSPATKLKKEQAQKLLGVLTPLQKKPKLTQDEAKAAIKQVVKIYDAKQLSLVDKAIQQSARRRGGGGGPGGGGASAGGPGGGSGGRSGPGGSTGNRPPFDPAKAKNFNPFNPTKDSPGYERNVDRNKRLFAFLKSRAAGKDAKLDLPTGRGPGGGGRPGGRG
jgi:hypothetical protein